MTRLVALALAIAAGAPATSPQEASVEAAVQVVRDYYAAVSRRDYRSAYAIWHGGQDYSHFRHGYAQTVRADVTPLPPVRTEGAAGTTAERVAVGWWRRRRRCGRAGSVGGARGASGVGSA